MAFEIDSSNWSGEGQFTLHLLDRLRGIVGIRSLRVEDAPATRSEADYQFMSNEIFVDFATLEQREPFRRFGFLPATRAVVRKSLTLTGLETALAAMPDIGEPDYADEGMLQYLRTERVVPPYQTRGYKLVELVRIYEAGTAPRS
ncbi:MAG TPA: hypothetical protein VH583_11400 [Vicinamibacterales bacterium]|jgi:hypothetical protein